jgi:multiple sugar transport system substrate-binding protein
MRKMRKKYILCLVLFAIFSGSIYESAVAKTKVDVISWWSSERGGLLEALKEACEKANPDIEINYIKVPGQEYYTKLLTMVASGKVPDMAMLGNDWLAPYASKGALEPLSRLISTKKFPIEAIYPSVRECLKYKGKYYALPRDTTSNVLFYNKKLFDQAGLKYPTDNWKWADFLAAAKTLTKVDQSGKTVQWGFYFDTFADGWYHWLLTNGTSFVNSKCNRSNMTSPQVIETLKFLESLISKYKAVPDIGQVKGLAGEEGVFLSQKAAMYIGGVSRAVNFAKDPNLSWDITPIPYNKVKTSRVWTNLWVVPKGNRQLNTVWKVISFYAGPEGQKIAAKFNSGIPAFKSIAESPAFLNSVPEHKKYFLVAFDNGKKFPSFPECNEFLTIMTRELEPVWAGERSVEEAVRMIDTQTNKLFKK